MSEIEKSKRSEEEQIEIEDKVLTFSEAGWTQRQIVEELGISFSSIKEYKERALSRMVLPDSETAAKEDVLFYDQIIREGIRMLGHPELGPSATNRPNLLGRVIEARKARSKAVKEHHEREAAAYGGGTLFDWVTWADSEGILDENMRAIQAWDERGQPEDVDVNDLHRDPSDGVYKLKSEFIEGTSDSHEQDDS